MRTALSDWRGPTVGEARRQAAARIAAGGSSSAALDARLLLGHVLGWSGAQVLTGDRDELCTDDLCAFELLVERRGAGEPVAHLVGRREFMGADYEVTPDTLIPRPDSEVIVETALSHAHDPHASLRVLDLGTGTGCLLISFLRERPGAVGVGVDRSASALKVAKRNAKALGVNARASFVQGDWAEALGGQFDVILINPPYIPSRHVDDLARDVRCFEPRLALDGGEDGLTALRSCLNALPSLLSDDGFAVIEFGYDQRSAIEQELRAQSHLRVGSFLSDLGGRDRGIMVTR